MKKIVLIIFCMFILISFVSGYAENIKFQNESGTDKVVIDKSQGNITLSDDGWFKGLFNWTIITGLADRYLSFDGVGLNFNEANLNATILEYGLNAGFNSTYNKSYAVNQSLYNHTLETFTNWGEFWYNQTEYNFTLETFNIYNSTWDSNGFSEFWYNQTEYNFTQEIITNYGQWFYNQTEYNFTLLTFNAYNSTWDQQAWAYNQSLYNHTQEVVTNYGQWFYNQTEYNFTDEVLDNYNSSWDNRPLFWDTAFNASFDQRDQDTGGTNNTKTYHNLFLNRTGATNYTLETFTQWGGFWYNQTEYNFTLETFTAYNSTWDQQAWAYNQSLYNHTQEIVTNYGQWFYNQTEYNFTKIIFDQYNSTWDNRGLIGSEGGDFFFFNFSDAFDANLTIGAMQTILNGSNMNFDKVGIGTDSLTHKLNVIGTGNFTGDVLAMDDVIAYDDLYAYDDLFVNGGIAHIGSSSGNIELVVNSIYPVIQYRDGATLRAQIMSVASSGAMYFDIPAGITFRSALNGGNTVFSIQADEDITLDGTTLFVDATGHEVGIGTSTPSAKLNVKGTMNVTGDSIFEGGVGINVANPTEALDVLGNINIEGIMTITRANIPTITAIDTTNTATIVMQAQDSLGFFGTTSTHPAYLASNNIAAIGIDTSQDTTFYGDLKMDSGNNILLGATSNLQLVDGKVEVCNLPTCSFSTATGDGDLGVEGDLEVDGTADFDASMYPTVSSSSNQACTTTCGGNGVFIAQAQTGASDYVVVDGNDATADKCVCTQ